MSSSIKSIFPTVQTFTKCMAPHIENDASSFINKMKPYMLSNPNLLLLWPYTLGLAPCLNAHRLTNSYQNWAYPTGNTAVLFSFALNVYDVNIVINHGVDLKAKSPPLIYCFMFRRLKSMPMVFRASQAHYNFGHHVNIEINKNTHN